MLCLIMLSFVNRTIIHFIEYKMSVNSYIANVYCLPVYPDV